MVYKVLYDLTFVYFSELAVPLSHSLGVFSSLIHRKFLPSEGICREWSSSLSWHELSLAAQLKFHVFIRTFLEHPSISVLMTWLAPIINHFLICLSSQLEGKLHKNGILFVLFSTTSPVAEQSGHSVDVCWVNENTIRTFPVSACYTSKSRWWVQDHLIFSPPIPNLAWPAKLFTPSSPLSPISFIFPQEK